MPYAICHFTSPLRNTLLIRGLGLENEFCYSLKSYQIGEISGFLDCQNFEYNDYIRVYIKTSNNLKVDFILITKVH